MCFFKSFNKSLGTLFVNRTVFYFHLLFLVFTYLFTLSFCLCSCRALSVRREIRELSYAERIQYQRLSSKLQIGGDKSVWNSLRNLYGTHIMHANSPLYFLLWNRNFLRTMERHLQEYDCSATIPYFDFTLDAGNLSASAVWRDDIFGAPAKNSTHCKRYAIPNSDILWTPCIRRDFDIGRNVPTMVDIAMALAKSDFFEFTSALQTISNHLHSFIGGDMDSEGKSKIKFDLILS